MEIPKDRKRRNIFISYSEIVNVLKVIAISLKVYHSFNFGKITNRTEERAPVGGIAATNLLLNNRSN